jgi:hypothetical protein
MNDNDDQKPTPGAYSDAVPYTYRSSAATKEREEASVMLWMAA